MKVLVSKRVLFVCGLVGAANAFAPAPHPKTPIMPTGTTSTTVVSMGMFDVGGTSKLKKNPAGKKKKNDDWLKDMFLKPMHGGGSAAKDKDLQEMYEAQQQVLANRRKHMDHNSLRSKYKAFGQDHLREIDTIAHDPKALNQKEDDAMYVDDDTSSFFGWNKKKSLKP